MEVYLGFLSTVILSPMGETYEKASVALIEETIHYRHDRRTHYRKQQRRNTKICNVLENGKHRRKSKRITAIMSLCVCRGGGGQKLKKLTK